jgi:hypothetical protein
MSTSNPVECSSWNQRFVCIFLESPIGWNLTSGAMPAFELQAVVLGFPVTDSCRPIVMEKYEVSILRNHFSQGEK